jgi:hypothetical protein
MAARIFVCLHFFVRFAKNRFQFPPPAATVEAPVAAGSGLYLFRFAKTASRFSHLRGA